MLKNIDKVGSPTKEEAPALSCDGVVKVKVLLMAFEIELYLASRLVIEECLV